MLLLKPMSRLLETNVGARPCKAATHRILHAEEPVQASLILFAGDDTGGVGHGRQREADRGGGCIHDRLTRHADLRGGRGKLSCMWRHHTGLRWRRQKHGVIHDCLMTLVAPMRIAKGGRTRLGLEYSMSGWPDGRI